MTMPHLMNCAHSPDGWCLDCVAKLAAEGDDLRARKDGAYEERNRVVAAFGAMCLSADWPVLVTKTAIEGWDAEWHNCIYFGTPFGQLSWHFHDDHAPLFAAFPRHGSVKWDEHDTPEKYRRIEKLVRAMGDSLLDRWPVGTDGPSLSPSPAPSPTEER